MGLGCSINHEYTYLIHGVCVGDLHVWKLKTRNYWLEEHM